MEVTLAEVLSKKTKGRKRKKHSHSHSDTRSQQSGVTRELSEMSDIKPQSKQDSGEGSQAQSKQDSGEGKAHADTLAQSQSSLVAQSQTQSQSQSQSQGAMTQASASASTSISDRAERMANYKPHTCLKLRIGRYKNFKKSSVYQRIKEPFFGIWWCVPEVHYICNPKIPEKYRLKGESGLRLKLHFMENQSLTPANMRAEPVIFNKLKTAYLMPFLRTEYPNLDCPKDSVGYIKRSYEKHLSWQNVLEQDAALELMASCHDRLQMATLLLDMRKEAPRFASRNKCFFKPHPSLPDKFQMRIDDLWTLTKELVGSTFDPRLEVKKRKNNILLHKIALFVNEYMEPVQNFSHYDGFATQIVTF